MNILRNTVSALGIPDLLRKTIYNNNLYAALFHSVHKRKYGSTYGPVQIADITIEEFRTCIKWFSERFCFLSLEDVLNGSTNGLIITVDDGFLNNLSMLEVIEEFNVPILLFVSTQHIVDSQNWLWFINNRYDKIKNEDLDPAILVDLFNGLGENGLIKMAQHPLVEVGCHTVTHPFLSSLSPEKKEHEIIEAKQYLESLLKKKVRAFSYPFNDYDMATYEIVSKHFEVAFTGVKPTLSLPVMYEIPRTSVHSADKHYLNIKFSGLHAKPLRL